MLEQLGVFGVIIITFLISSLDGFGGVISMTSYDRHN